MCEFQPQKCSHSKSTCSLISHQNGQEEYGCRGSTIYAPYSYFLLLFKLSLILLDAENYKLLMFTNNLSRSLTSLTVSLRDSELKMSLAMAGRVDEMVFKNPFQPKPHCGSVIPCHIPHTHSELQSKAATCSPRVSPLLPSLLFPLTVQAAGCSLAFFSDVAPKLLCSNVLKSFRYQKLKEVRSRLGECICK